MIRNIVRLEVKVAEKVYHLLCDQDSPINCVKEALFQLNKVVASLEEKIVEEQKKQEQEKTEAVQEEVVNEH